MGLWRDFLRRLGLTNDAHVHISAPGIEIAITGAPDQVRHMLSVVKYELERSIRKQELPETSQSAPEMPIKQLRKNKSGQFVQPSELDEMDSPYAFGARVVPVLEDETDSGDGSAPERKGADATLIPEGPQANLFPAEATYDSAPELDSNKTRLTPRASSITADMPAKSSPRVLSDLSAMAMLVKKSQEVDPEEATKETTAD